MSRPKWKRCSQSGEEQMLAWFPDNDYPGAVVCIGCSFGVLVVKGSVHDATSQTGYEGMAGKIRAHDVRGEEMRYVS